MVIKTLHGPQAGQSDSTQPVYISIPKQEGPISGGAHFKIEPSHPDPLTSLTFGRRPLCLVGKVNF